MKLVYLQNCKKSIENFQSVISILIDDILFMKHKTRQTDASIKH